jgi:hypothetical protein
MTGMHQGHSNVRNMQFDKAIEDNWNFANTLQKAGYHTIHLGMSARREASDWMTQRF